MLVRPTPAPPASGEIDVRLAARSRTTAIDDLRERGGLRLRRSRIAGFEAILVNTAGGIVGGDRLSVAIDCGAGSAATITSVAADKVYRAASVPARFAVRLQVAPGARLAWIPQETILFDGARFERSLDVSLEGDARLILAEMLVFGRLASGEAAITGELRDDWRVRHDGRLVLAEATRLEGPIGAILDRPAVGGGARATALLLVAGPDAAAVVEPLRAAFAVPEVEAGASLRDGIAVARALSRSPERLRAAMVEALRALGLAPLPRTWS